MILQKACKVFPNFADMENEMEWFEKAFGAAMASEVLPMDDMMRYVNMARGKRLRPRLVFLSARLFGEANDVTLRTALFVELFHNATLIHDDVVDDSDMRRGQASVKAKWNNQAAVLAGDFLLSKALIQLSHPLEQPILKEMLLTAIAMTEGELVQVVDPLKEAKVSEYLEMIERKTARLIRSCCVGGALSVHASEEAINKIGAFGLHLGLVFQMRDDILDDDMPEITPLAKQLLPEYLDKTLQDLDALAPYIQDTDVLDSLRELTVFCAERDH